MNKNLLVFSFLIFSLNSFSQEDDNIEIDLLFLKIQELEIEISDLRNELESQDYLIQKLIQESVQEDKKISSDADEFEDLNSINTIRFSGVDDTKSKEERDRLFWFVILFPLIILIILVPLYLNYNLEILRFLSNDNKGVERFPFLIITIAISTAYFEIFFILNYCFYYS